MIFTCFVKRRQALLAVPLFLVLILCPSAVATDIFVDAASRSAADPNSGTRDRPFKRLQEAVDIAKPGDVVRVKGGVYRESVRIPEGTKDAPVSIVAEPGKRPLITGADVVSGPWESKGGERYRAGWAHTTQIVLADGKPLKQIGAFRHLTPAGWKPPATLVGGNESQLPPGSFYYDQKKKALWIRLPGGANPTGHAIEASTRSIGVEMTSHTRLSGFDVAYFQTSENGEGNGIIISGEDIEICKCFAHHNDFCGIYPQGRSILIRECESSFNGNNGFTSCIGFFNTLEGCTTRGNNIRGYDMSWHGGGIKFVQQRNLTIQNHTAEKEAMGVWLDINCLDSLVANSLFKECDVGIYYEISRWGIIVNNVFQGCKRGIWSYSSDVLIANNALFRCPQGIVVTGEPRFAEYRLGPAGEPGLANNTLAAVRNNVIVNNLIVDAAEANVAIWPDNRSSGGHVCDYNAFVRTAPTPSGKAGFAFMSSWNNKVAVADWRSRGFDKKSLFCWPNAKISTHAAGVPSFSCNGTAVTFTPADHPIAQAGRMVGQKLLRGETSGGRPWALTEGKRDSKKSRFQFQGLWFDAWQRLPVQQQIAQTDSESPVSAGPIPRWAQPSKCPGFF